MAIKTVWQVGVQSILTLEAVGSVRLNDAGCSAIAMLALLAANWIGWSPEALD